MVAFTSSRSTSRFEVDEFLLYILPAKSEIPGLLLPVSEKNKIKNTRPKPIPAKKINHDLNKLFGIIRSKAPCFIVFCDEFLVNIVFDISDE
jgi:hypothetical protein